MTKMPIKLVVAEPDPIFYAEIKAGLGSISKLTLIECSPNQEALCKLLESGAPDLLMLGPGWEEDALLEVLALLTGKYPETPILVAVTEQCGFMAEIAQAGANETVSVPIESLKLLSAVEGAIEKFAVTSSGSLPSGREKKEGKIVTVFISTKGGVGKTVVAINLAVLAGSPKNMLVDSLVSVKIITAFITPFACMIFFIILGIAPIKMVFLLLVISAASFFIPDLWLSRMIRKRQRAIQLALPDTLDLLTISIEAGLGFNAALSKVAKNTNAVLSEEFFRLLQEVQLGASRREAFKNLLGRTDVPELNSFILAILQADVFGISIGKVLRVQAKDMRIKRRQRAEEMAMKTPVKIVFPLILCIFPALNIVILGPAAIQIYQNLFVR